METYTQRRKSGSRSPREQAHELMRQSASGVVKVGADEVKQNPLDQGEMMRAKNKAVNRDATNRNGGTPAHPRGAGKEPFHGGAVAPPAHADRGMLRLPMPVYRGVRPGDGSCNPTRRLPGPLPKMTGDNVGKPVSTVQSATRQLAEHRVGKRR
jgi:hypothetical protein